MHVGIKDWFVQSNPTDRPLTLLTTLLLRVIGVGTQQPVSLWCVCVCVCVRDALVQTSQRIAVLWKCRKAFKELRNNTFCVFWIFFNPDPRQVTELYITQLSERRLIFFPLLLAGSPAGCSSCKKRSACYFSSAQTSSSEQLQWQIER